MELFNSGYVHTPTIGQSAWSISETQCSESLMCYYRVATDLENLENSGNLKETSESQGICDRIPKVREFIFSQIEDPNFENFLGEHAPDPPKWSRTHSRAQSCYGKVRKKSGNFILSGKWQPCIMTSINGTIYL